MPDFQEYLDQIQELNYTALNTLGSGTSNIAYLAIRNAHGDLLPEFSELLNRLSIGQEATARRNYNLFFSTFEAILGIDIEVTNIQGTYNPQEEEFEYSGSIAGGISESFLQDFQEILGLNETDLGDWNDLLPLTGGNNRAFLETMFVGTMNAYLKSFPFGEFINSGQTNEERVTTFIENWHSFLTVRGSVADDTAVAGATIPLSTYRDLYFQFVKDANQAGFETALRDFTVETFNKEGYFLPSHFLEGWFAKVNTLGDISVNFVSGVAKTESFRTAVLLDLFKLLVEMIGVLQQVSATQAQRLTFYANQQRAYTDLISKVPVFGKEIFARSGGENEDKNAALGSLQGLSSNYTEKLRTWRSVVADEAKQHQTVVNQSNEIVNQQTNLGTSILQQLTTILTSIFR